MAKRSASATVTALSRLRPGEGALVEVVRHDLPRPDGTKAITLGIDMGTAPVPDRKYVADAAAVVKAVDGVRMMFAQHKLGKARGLRTLLVVHMSVDAVHNFAKSTKPLIEPLRGHGDICGPNDIPLIEIGEEPAQTIAFAANFVVCGYAGSEATLDFLHSSAFVIDHLVKSGRQLAVDPIVRVSLPSRLLLNLLDITAAIDREMKLPDARAAE
jgi:hypothetical protein